MRYLPPSSRLQPKGGHWLETEMRVHLGGQWFTIYATCWVDD